MSSARHEGGRVAVVTSHPIQYQAPWFRALANRLDLEVFFCHQATPENQAEAGFSEAFDWDIDLTGGYSHRFLSNVAPGTGSHEVLRLRYPGDSTRSWFEGNLAWSLSTGGTSSPMCKH